MDKPHQRQGGGGNPITLHEWPTTDEMLCEKTTQFLCQFPPKKGQTFREGQTGKSVGDCRLEANFPGEGWVDIHLWGAIHNAASTTLDKLT